jgi:hypothetical protein
MFNVGPNFRPCQELATLKIILLILPPFFSDTFSCGLYPMPVFNHIIINSPHTHTHSSHTHTHSSHTPRCIITHVAQSCNFLHARQDHTRSFLLPTQLTRCHLPTYYSISNITNRLLFYSIENPHNIVNGKLII